MDEEQSAATETILLSSDESGHVIFPSGSAAKMAAFFKHLNQLETMRLVSHNFGAAFIENGEALKTILLKTRSALPKDLTPATIRDTEGVEGSE